MKKLLVVMSIFFCQIYSQPVELKLNFSDGTKNIELRCGLHPEATDNFDRALGEEYMPPFPPGNIFDIRFRILDSISGIYETSLVDFRKGDSKTNAEITYPIYFQTTSEQMALNCSIPEGLTVHIMSEYLDVRIYAKITSDKDNSISFWKENNIIKLIVKYSGTTDFENEFEKIDQTELSIYPNPANSSAKINLNLQENDEIKLTLFNSIGEIVSTIYSGFLIKGVHEFSIDSGGLTSGVYFVTMNNSIKRITKKVVLLK